MKWLISACFVFVLSFAQAQNEFESALFGGLSVSQISGDGWGGWHKFGFNGGAFVEAPIVQKRNTLALNIAIQYIQKGSHNKLDTLTHNTLAYQLNYVEVPVNVVWKMRNFDLGVGPYYGVLVRQHFKSNGVKFDINPPYLKRDVGLAAQVKFNWNDNWFLELRASTSVLPARYANNYANKWSLYERGNYNQVLQFNIGRRF